MSSQACHHHLQQQQQQQRKGYGSQFRRRNLGRNASWQSKLLPLVALLLFLHISSVEMLTSCSFHTFLSSTHSPSPCSSAPSSSPSSPPSGSSFSEDLPLLLSALADDIDPSASSAFSCPAGADVAGDLIPPDQLYQPEQTPRSSQMPSANQQAAKLERVDIRDILRSEGESVAEPGGLPRSNARLVNFTSEAMDWERNSSKTLGWIVYELDNFCMRPREFGGLSMHGFNRLQSLMVMLKGLGICNEYGCSSFPISVFKSAEDNPRWVSNASAVIFLLSDPNPFHVANSIIPLAELLRSQKKSFLSSKVHLYPTLFRPKNLVRKQDMERIFSISAVQWWDLAPAVIPPDLSVVQVDNLDLSIYANFFVNRTMVQGVLKAASPVAVCYSHGILGLPLLFSRDNEGNDCEIKVPKTTVETFRRNALALATGDSTLDFNCSPPPANQKPLMGIIVRKQSRRLCNLQDLVLQAKEEGFDVQLLNFEDLSGLAQVEVTYRLDVLFGVHGAGMTNAFWLRKGAVVVEIYPDYPTKNLRDGFNSYPCLDYGKFAALSGAKHYIWVNVPLTRKFQPRMNRRFRKLDVLVEKDDLRKIMKDVMASIRDCS